MIRFEKVLCSEFSDFPDMIVEYIDWSVNITPQLFLNIVYLNYIIM